MSAPGHPVERLPDLLDDRLGAAEASEIRQHVAGCADCRRELDWLTAGRAAARVARGDVSDVAPADLRARVLSALDQSSADGSVPPRRRNRTSLWLGLAAAAALVLYLVGPWRQPASDPVDLALAQFTAQQSGVSPLDVRTSDAAALERYFNDPPQGPRVRVIDLAMMGWTIEGGARRRRGEVPVALYAYRSSTGADLVCQMYPGRLDDLPAADPRTDSVRRENGFEFRIYTRGSVTLVFWQEGELVCVLASDLPASEVVALAIAKAMAPA